MLQIKEQEDKLLVEHLFICGDFESNDAIEHAIKSVEHTIEVLKSVKINPPYQQLAEQTEILTELKAKL